MLVFKFGGASIQNAKAVRNVKRILDNYHNERLITVVSAMGKTTNALEAITNALYSSNHEKYKSLIDERIAFHLEIMDELFSDKKHPVFGEIQALFNDLLNRFHLPIAENYDFEYDQIVSIGEIVSSKIIHAFLSLERKDTFWADARTLIRTNNNYRSAEVKWDKTEKLIHSLTDSHSNKKVIVSQGFIGHTDEGFTTTLGREGSDFTAGIFAYCLNAKSVTIWKDVPGMLNADPKWFENTVKLDKISFKEAIELAYYGSSVIHPKTIKPLQNKSIPLYVKSFLNPTEEGTVIQHSTDNDDKVPSFIFKMGQVLLSITPKDFSFIVEENMSYIFKELAKVGAKINIMQNSALSFSVCLDVSETQLNQLISALSDEFIIKYNNGLELITIRHYNQSTIDRLTKGKTMLMEQKTRQTVRIVMQR